MLYIVRHVQVKMSINAHYYYHAFIDIKMGRVIEKRAFGHTFRTSGRFTYEMVTITRVNATRSSNLHGYLCILNFRCTKFIYTTIYMNLVK